MNKVRKVKVLMFRMVDQFTRKDRFVIVSQCSVSKDVEEAKTFFNEGLAKHFVCVAECEKHGPMPLKKAQAMSDACRKANPYVMVFNFPDDERAAS